MNNQFDELTRNMAQSVTRRAALKKFGLGLAGMALAGFGLTNRAHAGYLPCKTNADCQHLGKNFVCCPFKTAPGPICILRPFCGTGGHFP